MEDVKGEMMKSSVVICVGGVCFVIDIFFLKIQRPPRATPLYSSAASDVCKRRS